MKGDELAVIALGGTIDEWHDVRPSNRNLFLKIMGAITPVALGLADALPHRKVISIDTDGGILMNLNSLCSIGNEQPKNLVTIIMDNECYEVIGGPPTSTAGNVKLEVMAQGAGIKNAVSVSNLEEFEQKFVEAMALDEPSLIVCKIIKETVVIPDEKRKRSDGFEDKYNFVRQIEDDENITIIPRELNRYAYENKHLV